MGLGERIGMPSMKKVNNVQKFGNTSCHQTQSSGISMGTRVEGRVEWDRRWLHSINHTAVHLLYHVLREHISDNIYQDDSKISETGSTMNFYHYQPLDDEELELVETMVNQLILENLSISQGMYNIGELINTYGTDIFVDEIDEFIDAGFPDNQARVIVIGKRYIQTCVGTHAGNTGYLGLFKIVNQKRIHDALYQIEFKVGEEAVRYIQQQEKLLKESADVFSTQIENLPRVCARFFKEWKTLKKDLKRIKKSLVEE